MIKSVKNNPGMGVYDDDMTVSPKTKRKFKQTDELDDSERDPRFDEIEYGINIDDSVIYLHGDIMMGNLFDFIAKVRIILANRPEEKATDPINVLLNTNGGDVYEANGIIDYIQSLSLPVNIIARDRAMSSGAMILIAGTGVRVASKSTTIMFHEASAELYGKTADLKANADHIDELEEEFYTQMASKTKQDKEFWQKSCRKDFYLTAQKALELGVIDKIV